MTDTITLERVSYAHEVETVPQLARKFLDTWDRAKSEYWQLINLDEKQITTAQMRRLDALTVALTEYRERCPDVLRALVEDVEAVAA